jgi:hypothetical protein
MPTLPTYALISPARDEGLFIEQTIKAVISQTYRPLKWVIVSDGSRDETDDIVQKYAVSNPWIELIRMPLRWERNFAGKAHAFNVGYAAVAHLQPDIVGNLDADVSFTEDHFRILASKFAKDPELGVGGAPFREGSRQYDYRYSNIENVWGGCQLFRRECFEDIGGYVPLRGGGIDYVAVISARMKGWKTRTFTDTVCIHHRAMGTAQQGILKAKFRLGVKDYSVGNSALWEAFRTCYQMSRRPFVVGALAMAGGYSWSLLRRAETSVSPELRAFVRAEQMHRLGRFFHSTLPSWPRKSKSSDINQLSAS